MSGSDVPEWVVIIKDRRLAIVKERTKRGVEVEFPLGGGRSKFPVEDVEPFDPQEHPIQISFKQRKKIRAAGKVPRDEVEKVCNKCFRLLNVKSFEINQTRKDGSSIRRPTCMDCRKGIEGVKNHDTRYDKSQPAKPPVGEFWKCAICEKSGIVGVTVKLVLDHDHLSGHARDYICDSCNTGLGRFRNGKDFLDNAAAFIEKFQERDS